MECWYCKAPLIWGGDHDLDDEGYSMSSSFSCPKCNAFVLMYMPKEKSDD